MQQEHYRPSGIPHPAPPASPMTCAPLVSLRPPRRSRAETVVFALLALALCALVIEVAFFWMNGSIDRAFENAAYQQEIDANAAYFAEHKGEESAHDIGVEKGLLFSWGLMLPRFDEGVEEDGELMSLANSELSYVPDYIKSKFSEDGWQMLLTDQDLCAMYYDGEDQVYDPLTSENVLGLTSPNSKTIFISADRYSVLESCVHEMGHYVDRCLGYLSQGEEFKSALSSDKGMYSFYFPYSHLDVDEELFAEAFGAYWKHPAQLESFCPNLYAYFSSRF